MHELLEDLDFGRPGPPDDAAVAAVAAERDLELTAAETQDVARLVEAFARSPLCRRLASAHAVRREAPFTFTLDEDSRGPLVNGIVDVVATEADGSVLVVDYKTNPLEGTDPEALTEADYALQRLVYALAALRDGAPRVEVAHCYLERPAEPATRTYGQADAQTLADELARRAGGLLAGDFSPTPAAAPRAVRQLPREASAVLASRGSDAEAVATPCRVSRRGGRRSRH